MSNIKELANVPEISFIENMSLQETEELVRANYTRIFKELTGQDAELGEADAKNLIIKSFSLVLYQVMQYVEAKGRAELLKTSTGDALDALAALFGITRQEARRATCIVRFTLSGQRSEPTERSTRWWTPSPTLRAWRASRRARADWTSRTTTV